MANVLLVNYDNGGYVSQPPHGLAYLGAALRNAGHRVSVWDAAIHHYPPERLTETIDDIRPDVVAVSVIGGYWQYRQLLALSKAINASGWRDRLWYVTGGHGPASDPEYFKAKTGCDTVFVGEGEADFPKAVNAFAAGALTSTTSAKRGLYEHIHSVGVPVLDSVIHGTPVDVDAVPWPAWDLFDVNVYRLVRYPCVGTTEFAMPVLSGRGCVHSCSFCYRLVPGYRPRDVKAVAEEIAWLKKDYGVGFINLDDELAMVGRQRTLDLCEALKPTGVGWMCNGRLDIAARFPELLPAMKDAGCRFINYGVESLSQPVLDEMNKRLTVEQIEAGVQATIDAGIHPGLNVMFGAPNDNLESLRKLVAFLKRRDTQAQVRTIRPVTPYPGSPLFGRAVAEGRIRDTADFYENKHVNSDLATVQWTDMGDDEFHEALYKANCDLIKWGMFKKTTGMLDEMRDLYINGNASWRGFRHG